MALAKQARGGMSGWLAAVLLALGVFAAVAESDDETTPSDDTVVVVEASPND